MSYDLIVVGAGPAGLTAGIYAARSGLKTLILEKVFVGGQITQTAHIENYPGYLEGDGFALTDIFRQQAEKFGCQIISQNVTKITPGEVVTTQASYACKSVVLAMGARPAHLNVPGEKELVGKGVSYCATCDGAFFKEKVVAVIGGGDAAVEEALFLSKFASKVYIVHRRDKLRATKVIADRAKANPKISFVWDSVVAQIEGEEKVTGVTLKSVKSSLNQTVAVDGVFVYVGTNPQTDLVKELVQLDEKGFILTDKEQKTSAASIYAAGDICQKSLRQVVTAASDGAVAAFNIEKEFSE